MAVPLDEIRHRVEAEPIDAHIEPKRMTLNTSRHRGLSKFKSGWCE